MKSILQNKKECFRCGNTLDLHKHHVFEGVANRKKSESDGLTIYLCGKHHNLSNDGIHFDKTFDLVVKKFAQKKYEESSTREDFIKRYGRSYL